MLKLVTVFIAILLVSACSGKQAYRFGQDYQKSDCALNVISLQQYGQCMRNYQLSYEYYQKERQAVIKDMSAEKNKEL